jgi:endonuclease YncB( thermonuclease family)
MLACAFALGTLAPAARAAGEEARVGRIAHVVDGDTVDILLNDRRVRVRLAGIEAPTRGKFDSLRSRQSLVQLCGGEIATLQPKGRARGGVMPARVTCAGTDAAAEQVRRGMASVSADGDAELHTAEKEARAARRGVWSAQVSATTGAK